MAIPTSKTELISAISDRFEKLEKAFLAVPESIVNEKTMEGHVKATLMSPADLAAYLVGWNELVLKWLKADDAGENVVFPEVGYKWNELGELAQKFYDDYANLTFQQKLSRLSEAKRRIISTISERSDDELYGTPWHGKYTKGRMIQFNTSSPYENARGRLRKWLKQHG